MEYTYDNVRSNDQSQNVSQISNNSRQKLELNFECHSSKHTNGANQRQNLFTLNDEMRMVNAVKNKEDTDIVIEPSIISNQKMTKIVDISLSDNDMMKEKSNVLPIQQQPHEQSFRKSSKYDSLKVSTARINDTVLQIQNLKESLSGDGALDNNDNTNKNAYDQHIDRESKRFQLSEASPQQKQGLLSGGNKLQNLTLYSTKTKIRDSSKDLPKSARSSQRITPPGQSFFLRMKISHIIRRFIIKISSLSMGYNLRQLTKKHYDMINDKSAIYIEHNTIEQNMNQRPAIIQFFLTYFLIVKEFFDSVEPFNPESRFSVICDSIYGIALLAYLFTVPIELSFMVEFETFELVVFIIFVVNFALTLNKCYYSEGRIISNRKQIFIHFVKKHLLIDVLVFASMRLNMFQYVVFLKFFDINNIIKRVDNHFQIISKIPIIFSLVNLVVKMCLIAQIAGCTFHYVARLELEQNYHTNTWLTEQNMVHAQWQSRYVVSIYFAFITMMTVGYGDVIPVNNNERIYVIFMTLLSSAIFGYVVNTIGMLYQQQAQKQEQFQKRKQEINLFMDERKIDSETKIKILNYLEYAYQYKKKKEYDPQTLFHDIPQTLVEEICINYYGRYLYQNKIMKLNFSDASLKFLSTCMKEKNLAPNEFLFHKGMTEQKVYFLVSGQIDIVVEGKDYQNSVSSISREGEEIGLRSAFISQGRSTSAKCYKDSNCTLVYFEIEDFKRILSHFPKDYERYCEIKDDILFNQNTLDTKCASCQRYDHSMSNCPLVSLNIQKDTFLYRYNNSGEPQSRSENFRRGKRVNCLKQNADIRAKLKHYRMSLVFMIIPELREAERDFKDRSDKFFYNRMPTVKVMDGGDMEAEMEEYNIYEGYQTMGPDDQPYVDEDESYSDVLPNRKLEEEHYLSIQGESGENMLGSSSYSSSYHNNQQLYPQQVQFPIPGKENSNSQQLQVVSNNLSAQQKMSLFAKKSTTQNIEAPAVVANINDGSPQVNINTVNQASSRNLSFRRERGDSFYPPGKRGSKQYSQQRSLQSRVKSARKTSEIIQHSSNKPTNSQVQVSFNQDNTPEIIEYAQPIFDLFIYDFDRQKIFEKYFPNFNFTNVINRMSKKRIKKQHKTIFITSPTKKRLSKKINHNDSRILLYQH